MAQKGKGGHSAHRWPVRQPSSRPEHLLRNLKFNERVSVPVQPLMLYFTKGSIQNKKDYENETGDFLPSVTRNQKQKISLCKPRSMQFLGMLFRFSEKHFYECVLQSLVDASELYCVKFADH